VCNFKRQARGRDVNSPQARWREYSSLVVAVHRNTDLSQRNIDPLTDTHESRFDWALARSRVEALSDSLEHGAAVSAEASQVILEERARRYAIAPERSLLASEQVELLTFRLADEQYAIESRFVYEALHLPELTPLPGAPACVSGVTNLRGEILAVMDLGQALGCPSARVTPEWIIVLGLNSIEMGIVSDAVLEVTAVRTDSVLAPARAARDLHPTWIRGVTSNAVVVLEGQAVLDDPLFHIDQPET